MPRNDLLWALMMLMRQQGDEWRGAPTSNECCVVLFVSSLSFKKAKPRRSKKNGAQSTSRPLWRLLEDELFLKANSVARKPIAHFFRSRPHFVNNFHDPRSTMMAIDCLLIQDSLVRLVLGSFTAPTPASSYFGSPYLPFPVLLSTGWIESAIRLTAIAHFACFTRPPISSLFSQRTLRLHHHHGGGIGD
jgi:hypothetical protein